MYTIIIPSMGRVNFLNSLLESIYNQTIPPKEIIILLDKDNNIDNDFELEKKLVSKKDNCNLIFCKKLTLPQKRNYGVELSKTNIIIFSDDDDIWDFKKAELTLKSLKTNQVVCHAYSKFGFLETAPKYKLGKKKKLVSIFSLIYGDNIFGGGSGIAAKKEILLSIPFKNYLSCEDFDWWVNIILAGVKIEYIPMPLVKYRVHDKNMTSNFYKIFQYNRIIFNKFIYKSTILFFAFILGYSRSLFSFLIKYINLNINKLKKYF